MKNIQILKELREKDIKALTKELIEMRQKMTKMRTDLAFKKLKNIRQIRETRCRIAQIWTVINEKAMNNISAQEVTK